MGFFKRLLVRLGFGRTGVDPKREWPPQLFDPMTLAQLYDILRDAIPGSPLEVRTRAELRNRLESLQEWVTIYRRSPTGSWAEDLSLRRIRKARATDEEWHQVSLTSPENSPLHRIAQQKMN